MISLSNLRRNQSRRTYKRVGRGNSSGKGTTAGRGTKGQRARTGGRNKLTRRGLKHLIERTPKVSGRPSRRAKLIVVTLSELNRVFADGQKVNATDMVKAGLIRTSWPGVKVVGGSDIKKKLMVTATKFTAGAAAAITKAGGQAQPLAPKVETTKTTKDKA